MKMEKGEEERTTRIFVKFTGLIDRIEMLWEKKQRRGDTQFGITS